jgi:hypothetical protein
MQKMERFYLWFQPEYEVKDIGNRACHSRLFKRCENRLLRGGYQIELDSTAEHSY